MTPEIKQRIEQIRRGEVPEGYKRVKIGVVPQSWLEERFETISKIYGGGTPETANEKFWNGEIYWCTPTDITESSKFISKTRKKISQLGFENSSVQMLPVGSILMCSRATIGPRCINTVPMTTNQGFKSLVCNSEIANTLYIFDLIDLCIKDFIKLSSGSTFLELSKTDLAKYKVPLPPISEQQKIAEILTAQDKVIELKEKLLNEKQRQKKYLMQQLLTGKKRLPGFSGEWKYPKAREVFANVSDKEHNGDLVVLSSTQDRGIVPRDEVDIDIKYDSSLLINYKKVCRGNFVISLRSFQGGIEYSAYTGLVSPAYTVLSSTKEISDEYYKQFFKSADYINRLNVAVYGIRDGKQISYEDFGRLRIPYPPVKEQTAIAEILSTADREIELLQKDIEQEKQKKKALMQLLLTGIVRV